MENSLSLSQLLPSEDEKWLFEIKKQIKKDFDLQGLNLPVSEEDNNLDFFNALLMELQHFVDSDFASLLNLLYRMDINEDKMRAALHASNENAAVIICRFMALRAYEKAQLRAYYKG